MSRPDPAPRTRPRSHAGPVVRRAKRAELPGHRREAYAGQAGRYDARTDRFDPWRRRLVELMPIRRGDAVLDVGCGTGRCFPALQERVGPEGTIIGIDPSPEMLGQAACRVSERGWRNVTLQQADADGLELAEPVDHVLLCAVHDVLQSERALSTVLSRVRAGGSVAAGGGKWAPGWAVGVNLGVALLHRPFVQDFAGFDRPWAGLAERVVDLRVEEVAVGGGFLAVGQVPDGRTARAVGR